MERKNQENDNQKKQNKGTKGDDWKPSPYQMRLVELLVNPEDRRSKKDKCEEAGVTRKTLYEWLKKPEFVAYMNSQIGKYTDAELPEVWRAHMMQVKRGNMQAIELYYKIKGLLPGTKMKTKVTQTGPGANGESNVTEIEVTLTDED